MSANILIIEDEKPIITLLEYNLTKEGYKVKSAESGEEGIQSIKNNIPDLIILDWMLPDFSGVEVCRQLKKNKIFKTIPILMLTAKSQEEDKIVGFETGVDDYVTKPFSQKEILLRIKSLLKRTKPTLVEDISIYQDLKIDRITKKIFRGNDEIKLGPTEFKILDFLIKNPKRVYSREQLLNGVWGDSVNVEQRTIDVHIRRLRKTLNQNNKIDLIRTVRSSGYSLDADI
ncbi:MAG: phosphate regulon transcriptional regulatory protein PhoB [Pelagibacterales bacterium]|nr:phosphate regulon transcriptional regulatory protein PhoB [Pelagibacterales bacterium]